MDGCKHNDCINYECIDVTKGICLEDEQYVPFDGNSCPRFSPKSKCKYCSKFKKQNGEDLGICVGLEDGEHWISGEMIAITCHAYEETYNV